MISALIRVGLIEDHAVVRTALKIMLSAEPDIQVIGEAWDRKSSLELAGREKPDLFLVDIQLATESAVDFLGELIGSCNAKALLLTCTNSDEQIHLAIQAGATGMVAKHEEAEVLFQAIRKVHAGEAWFPRALMSSALARFRNVMNSKSHNDPERAKIADLTVREREIVVLLSNGFNRKRISEKLFVSEATVRNHLSSIFGKLDVSNQLELVFYARRHGLDNVSASSELSASKDRLSGTFQ